MSTLIARDVQDLMTAMQDWYGIALTEEQTRTIAEATPGFVKDVVDCGVDTVAREWFATLIGEWLGLKGHWPMNGDPPTYSAAYFLSFAEKAKEKGIVLTWEEGTFPGSDE